MLEEQPLSAPPVWSEKFRVRFYEAQPGGLLGPAGLANYLQEAAANHAAALDVSIDRLASDGLGWGLVRLFMRLDSPPRTGQEIEVRTWPSDTARVAVIRDFQVLDADGRQLASAVSQWVTFDLAGRKVARLPDYIVDRCRLDVPPSLGFKTRTVKMDPGEEHEVLSFRARPGDLDGNGHVNNAFLINWITSTAPLDNGRRPLNMDIMFRAECRQGQKAASMVRSGKETNQSHHRLIRVEDGRELARAVIGWTDNPQAA